MKTIKEAIIYYIKMRAETQKILAENNKPCEHDWELLNTSEWASRLNPECKWLEYTYRCKKCCESKNVKTND